MIGAGLLARNAVRKGLKTKPWVKTSLAPGSQIVAEYFEKAGLQERSRRARLQPRRLRLHHLHRQFRAAAGERLEGDQRQRSRRRLGALRQPQLRGPRQSGRARELSRLAAPRRRLRARRLDARRSDAGAPRHRHATASRSFSRTSGRPPSKCRSSSTAPSRANCSRGATRTCSRAMRTGRRSRSSPASPSSGTSVRPTCRTRPISRA